MRVFLDACIDPRVTELFEGHEVATAFQLGWHQLKDHLLLPRLQGQFDVLVTIDGGFEHEHNLKNLSFGIVTVHVSGASLLLNWGLKRPVKHAVSARVDTGRCALPPEMALAPKSPS